MSSSGVVVGVGMGLKCRADGSLEITEIVPNGPVHKSNRIRLGDILRRVNGKEVGRTVSSARDLLMGPPGTAVSLSITRHESFFGIDAMKVENSFVVSVLRAAPPSPPSTPARDKGSSRIGEDDLTKESPRYNIATTSPTFSVNAVDPETPNQEEKHETSPFPEGSDSNEKVRMLEAENEQLRKERELMFRRLDESNVQVRTTMEQLKKSREENTQLRGEQTEMRSALGHLQESAGEQVNKLYLHEQSIRGEAEKRERRLCEDMAGLRRTLDQAQKDIVRITQENIRCVSERDIAKDEVRMLNLQLMKAKEELKHQKLDHSRYYLH
jgi:hypothetical protein